MFRRILIPLAVVAAIAASSRLAADVVWTPQEGWKIEGGMISNMNPTDARNALGFMNKARAAEEKRHYRTALRNYKKVTKRYSESVYGPVAFNRTARIRLLRRQYVKSFQAFQEIITRYPSTPMFTQVIGEQYRIACALLDGARSRGWLIFPGFRSRETAIGLFETIVINAPYSEYAPLSLMCAARGHQILKSPAEAIDALDRMINTYPKHVLTPTAYLQLGQSNAALVEGAYYDQSFTKEAITYFEDFVILFPGDSNVGIAEKGLADMKQVLADSKMKVGDYYLKYRKNYKAARVFYNEAITDYPDSPIAAKARAQLTKVDALLAAQEKMAAAEASKPAPQKKKKRFFFF